VSFHVPLVEGTKHLLNEQRIALLPKGATVLNFARDGIIDEDALISLRFDLPYSEYFDAQLPNESPLFSAFLPLENSLNLKYYFSQSDFVSFHVPLVEGTKHLLNEQRIALLPKGATARVLRSIKKWMPSYELSALFTEFAESSLNQYNNALVSYFV
jgi:hypothetical protein